MMCRGSKGVVLGGVLACVGATRSHVDMKSAGAVHAVDTMASLSLQHEDVRRIAEAVDGQATPGASDPYTNSLKAVLDKIKGELKPRVKDAQQDAQRNIDDAFTAAQEAERSAVAAKGTADKQDQAWFACVSEELRKKDFHETWEGKLEEAQTDEKEANALKEGSRKFTFKAGNKYQTSMQCDNGVAGGCMRQKNSMMASWKKMIQDAKEKLDAKMKYFQDVETQHKNRQAETAAAKKEVAAAAENHESHRSKCEAAKQRRDRAVCEYGDTVQAKGVEETEFQTLIAAVDRKGGEMSESDRKQEWKTLSHMECMLERGIAKGLKGGPVNANDHGACADQPDLTPLARKASEFGKLTQSHPNAARAISFGNGQAWTVSSNGETAADYSKGEFKPTLNPNAGEQPFDMCPKENADSWKNLVSEKMVGASEVGGGAWEVLTEKFKGLLR